MNNLALSVKEIGLKCLHKGAAIRGQVRRHWLLNIWLPIQKRGGDINKINVRVSASNFSDLRLILRKMGAKLDDSSYIDTHLILHNAYVDYSNLYVGPHCYIGKDCFLDLADRIVLEANVTLAMRVTVLTHFDAGESSAKKIYPKERRSVLFKRGVYVGAGAIILPGVTVGEHAMIAAGAVVTEDVPPMTLVGGVPAKVLRSLSSPAFHEEAAP